MANILTLTHPLMRQTVGFDRFSDMFESLLREPAGNFNNYPPYNIEKLGPDDYKIVMAVAGFKMDDLNIVLENGTLKITGDMNKEAAEGEPGAEVLYRGIATRAFERTFRLADHIQVTSAEMKDGLLTINLVREVPEEKKPRTIQIGSADQPLLTTAKKK